MATATHTKENIYEYQKVVKETVNHYTLTMTLDEAQALMDILAKIGGHPEKSRRRYMQAIYEALQKTGLRFQGDYMGQSYFRDHAKDFTTESGIFFKDEQ